MADGEMLYRTLDRVLANPQEHDQASWRCDTGMCFAGHASVEAGGVWLTEQYPHAERALLVPEEGDPPSILRQTRVLVDGCYATVTGVHCSDRARLVLGLTIWESSRLFRGSNTVEALKELVDESVAAAPDEAGGQQPPERVPGGR